MTGPRRPPAARVARLATPATAEPTAPPVAEAAAAPPPVADGTTPAQIPRGGTGASSAPDAAPEATSGASSQQDETTSRAVLSVLTTLGPPLTIATALMLYFGWDRSQEQARSMGLDVSLFGYSTQDYVLRSINTLYLPLLAAAGLGLGWLALHWRLVAALARPELRPRLRTAGRVALWAGLAVGAVAVVEATRQGPNTPLLLPLVLAVAAAVAAYGGWLTEAASPQPVNPRPVAHRALRSLLVGAVVTLALFWQLSDYAGIVGRGSAQQIAASVPGLPRAIAYSGVPLALDAPGVREERIETRDAAGKTVALFRTTGLRLLTKSGGHLFFVHDGWTPRTGVVVVLPDDNAVRWEFSR